MRTNKLKVVIDTNVLLVILPINSPYHNIFQSLIREDFIICITNEILFEYEEQLSIRFKKDRYQGLLKEIAGLNNSISTYYYFRFNIIEADPDDNKFVDCAIAANADYIVTNDKHLNILSTIPFPKVETLTLQAFQKILFPQ
jgi:putative PIN family toxin of toxin-antitoxin system